MNDDAYEDRMRVWRTRDADLGRRQDPVDCARRARLKGEPDAHYVARAMPTNKPRSARRIAHLARSLDLSSDPESRTYSLDDLVTSAQRDVADAKTDEERRRAENRLAMWRDWKACLEPEGAIERERREGVG